ncbi:hypothetical protein [Ramlibacter rhizophilus]|uniref:Uncharacterized protein n=1 Tax=Ramlibacter rhizophilus TaxID=1781167 RepID=A0A4Z0BSF1_9BURK|nr:hypothetical protein [Ramlibacter rhizophilus]TFZ01360.1 hypothetical protein EZ242_08250 [Ramlibacter rhizophilus]
MPPHSELEEVLKPHLARVLELETQARIKHHADWAREASKRARDAAAERGDPPDPVDPEISRARDADHVRTTLRDLYFAVPDSGLRREMLSAQRHLQDVRASHGRLEFQQVSMHLQNAKNAAKRFLWGPAILVAAIAFAAGAFFVDPVVAGMLALIPGLAVAWRSHTRVQNELRRAKAAYRRANRRRCIRELYPDTLSEQEVHAGLRDRTRDRESAYKNLMRFLEREGQ